jgi:hypothetical protein
VTNVAQADKQTVLEVATALAFDTPSHEIMTKLRQRGLSGTEAFSAIRKGRDFLTLARELQQSKGWVSRHTA